MKPVNIDPKKAASRTKMASTRMNTVEWERFEELKEEYGFGTDSAALRYFINIGMRATVETDPRNSRSKAESQNPVPKIRDYIPEGKENAVDLKDDLPDIIAENMLDIAEADDKIKRDGFEVWK